MFGWFAKKSQNARVYMVSKELKWKFQIWPQWRIAKARLMGNAVMTQILSAERAMAEFFNNPFAYSRDHAMEIYEALEEIRNHTKLQLEGNNKSMARLGITIPQIVLDHVEDTIRGIELWMLVPGMVVNSERAETVDSIW